MPLTPTTWLASLRNCYNSATIFDVSMVGSSSGFSSYLEPFSDLPKLRDRVKHVLNSLPSEVQQDFLNDSRFSVSLDNFEPGKGSTVFMAAPAAGVGSRSIVLKPLLNQCAEEFAHYVIAHEFAHAFLRNGPWGDITNVEDAANGLAAFWGFPQPEENPWGRRKFR